MKARRDITKRITSSLLLAASVLSLVSGDKTGLAQVHTVQKGEYIYQIARDYNVTPAQIIEWNNLSGDYLAEGQQIYVGNSAPLNDTATSVQVEAPGDNTSSQDQANQTSAQTAPQIIYTVQSGDNLSSIASRYGTTVEQLLAWNGLATDWLNVGDQLTIYASGGSSAGTISPITSSASGASYVIQPGDTLDGIAAVNGISLVDLMAANGLGSSMIYAGQNLIIPGVTTATTYQAPTSYADSPTTYQGGGVHSVQSGDTLGAIAATYGVTVDQLMAWNGLATDWLNVGDQISVVPSDAAPSSSQVSTSTDESETSDGQSTTARTTRRTPQSRTNNQTNRRQRQPVSITGDSNRSPRINVLDMLPEENRVETHEVKEGDNLDSIAAEYSVPKRNLLIWNDLEENAEPAVGDELFVENPAMVPKIHLVTAEDNLEGIAEEYKTSVENIVRWNVFDEDGLPLADDAEIDLADFAIIQGDELIVSDPTPETHTVQPGERIEGIADQYNVTAEELKEWNYIPQEVSVVNGTLIVSNPNGMDSSANGDEPAADQESEDQTTEESSQN